HLTQRRELTQRERGKHVSEHVRQLKVTFPEIREVDQALELSVHAVHPGQITDRDYRHGSQPEHCASARASGVTEEIDCLEREDERAKILSVDDGERPADVGEKPPTVLGLNQFPER